MNEQQRSEVLHRWYGGQSGRKIARDLHVSRKTVAKVIADHEHDRATGTTGLPSPRQQRESLVDPYEARLRDYLARYPDISAVRLLEELRRRGYSGSYTVLRQRVKQLRQRGHRPPVERFETGPGLQAQMDWAVYTLDFTQEGRRKVNLFSYVLGYSRRQYIHFTASQDLETTLREHVRAFEHLQGAAATCLYDNMKVVVARYEDGEPIYNTRFLAFATHYGFRPVACRPRRPRTKGMVEAKVRYVKQSALARRAEELTTWDAYRRLASTWRDEVANVRLHATTKERPVDRFEKERPHLRPPPPIPFDTDEILSAVVTPHARIHYDGNRYSVPPELVRKTVHVHSGRPACRSDG